MQSDGCALCFLLGAWLHSVGFTLAGVLLAALALGYFFGGNTPA